MAKTGYEANEGNEGNEANEANEEAQIYPSMF